MTSAGVTARPTVAGRRRDARVRTSQRARFLDVVVHASSRLAGAVRRTRSVQFGRTGFAFFTRSTEAMNGPAASGVISAKNDVARRRFRMGFGARNII